MKEQFIDWKPTKASLALLGEIDTILGLYEAQGYELTLRQLYYQLVSRDLIPNSVQSYNKIGDLVSNGRLAGCIDWDMIEDRSRHASTRAHWSSPSEILDAAAQSYYRDRWSNQAHHVEVWCEKDAVSNILEPVCRKWDVLFMANRGYSSQSAMYAASYRFRAAMNRGQDCVVIYFGDHDPSGIDMTRDITDRLSLFTHGDFEGVERVALNMDQVRTYRPPENPAKATDSRYAAYTAIHGYSSWELDALEPAVLASLVEDSISQYVDAEAWDKVQLKEERHKAAIWEAAAHLKLFDDEEEEG